MNLSVEGVHSAFDVDLIAIARCDWNHNVLTPPR